MKIKPNYKINKLRGAIIASMLAVTAQTPMQAQASNEVSAAINDHIPLGTAYNKYSGEFINVQTITGKVVEGGNTIGNIFTQSNQNFRQLSSRLAGEVSVDLNFPAIQANANASVALQSANDEFTANWIFSSINKVGSKVLNPLTGDSSPKLSSVGNTISTWSATQKLEYAGTSYISEIEYGNQLFVAMTMKFLNEQDKLEVEGELSVDYATGVVTASGNVNAMSEEKKSSVKITVSAYQFGGEPLNLLRIIPNNIVTCDLNDYNPCFQVFKNAVEYGRGIGDFAGENSFNANSASSIETANVIGYRKTDYNEGAPEIYALHVSSVTPDDNDAIIEALENDYATEIQNRGRAQAMLKHYSGYLTPSLQDELFAANNKATNNAYALALMADYCRENYLGGDCTTYINSNNCAVSGGSRPCLESYDINDFTLPQIPNQYELVLEFAESEAERETLARQGYTCELMNEPNDAGPWSDTYMCSNIDIGLTWSHSGPISNMACTIIVEGAEDNWTTAWKNNYMCLPQDSEWQLMFESTGGPETVLANNDYTCTAVNPSDDPHAWADNSLCYRAKWRLDFASDIDQKYALQSQGMECIAINDASESATWEDNYLCSNIAIADIGLEWSESGAIAGKTCTNIDEDADGAHWDNNHLCLPSDSTRELNWITSSGGQGGLENAGYQCTDVREENDTAGTWTDNRLCYRDNIDLIFQWAQSDDSKRFWESREYGNCTQIIEPSNLGHGWGNNYLCTNQDIGLKWSYAGEIPNMACTNIDEDADGSYWDDNYMCLPNDSRWELTWTTADGGRDTKLSQGYACKKIIEEDDPNTWGDNWLCYKEKKVYGE